MRGMVGLTVTCARCHDHKYDPIPTADYYSLYGVFAASQETMRPIAEATPEYTAELAKRETAVRELLEAKHGALQRSMREQPARYLAAGWEENYAARDPDFWKKDSSPELSPRLVERWKGYLQRTVSPDDPVFGPWHQLSAISADAFPARAAELCTQIADPAKFPQLNARVAALLAGFQPRSFDELIDRYGRLLSDIDREWQDLVNDAAADHKSVPTALPDAAAEQLRQILYGDGSPAVFSVDDAERLLRREDRRELRELRNQVDKWMNSEGGPVQASVLIDRTGSIDSPRVFVRGNPNNPGPEVPRQFLRLVAGESRQPFQQGSGRLELARAIVDPANPLTARVWVNRVWEHLFGRGLVDTPSDFGLRSDRPTHPELLDYLASQFIAEGWSTKQLIAQIVLSATYQQSARYRADAAAVDPENRLLWRMNRRRLDFEAMRDSLLSVSGTLDPTIYGPSVDIAASPAPRRRTVYSYIDRQNLPGVFRTFDFASPDTHAPRRYLTTVPQQALFLMNHPLVAELAEQVMGRAELVNSHDTTDRIQRLYRLLFMRPPADEELQMGRTFVENAGDGEQTQVWSRYVQALMMSNEFVFQE
jgi:hypothetical protein